MKTRRSSPRRSGSNGGEVDPIAIVGMGCRFPGAHGPEAFWRLLLDGRDAIAPVPSNRWNHEALYHPDPVAAPGSIATRLGGFLDGIEQFDATFFGIAPREAAAIDPQQRLLLESSWEALEDAGLAVEGLCGKRVGVFVGIAAYDYAEIQHGHDNRHLIGPHTNTGLALSIAANRISYLFDFRGPSVAVDTACSSSLVAVHIACRSLRSRESEAALVGGVNVILKPEATIGFSRASMLAPDGRCKMFDARANGYSRGEGAGVVVVKRLSDALAAGDHIYALIRGSAVNQDGRTKGMSVPSQEAQEAAVRDALAAAGIDPAHVQYIEAHGTGTPVGDPIEARALGGVLAHRRPAGDRCLTGSVKTNIGHLEAAAGIAGLIKTALAVEQHTIPASLHFEHPNPEIPLDELKLRVVTQTRPWPDNGQPACAGINSFGFGGTNAHVVLEQAPPAAAAGDTAAPPSVPLVLPLSARAPEVLRELASRYADTLERGDSEAHARAVCYWASVRRSHHDHRTAVVGGSVQELAAQLRNLATPGGTPRGDRNLRRSGGALVFVYSGMGSQWWGMGRQLLATEPVFRQAIERCDELFTRLAGWSLLQELSAAEHDSRMHRTDVSQPCNFALQIGLTELWATWGVVPGAIVGHSTGEVAASHVAGVLTLEQAVQVTYHRSRLQQKLSGRGQMAAVGLSEAQALERIERYGNRLSVAAINGPRSVTLSGDGDALDEIAATLVEDNTFFRRLRVEVPYHSHCMEDIRQELLESLSGLAPEPPRVPLFSTVHGGRVEERSFDAGYWWQNVRQPVRFVEAIENLARAGNETFLEISAHPVLASAVSECLEALQLPGAALASLRRQTDEPLTMRRALAELYGRGVDIRWAGLYPHAEPFVRLPLYPWQRQSYWLESPRSKGVRLASLDHPLLGRRRSGPRFEWENLLDARALGYLNDHRIEGAMVYPGAGYVEMALAVARAELGTVSAVVEDMVFERALVLPEAEAVQVIVSYDPESGEVAVDASTDGAKWERHAHGAIRALRESADVCDLAALQRACGHELPNPYEVFAGAGLEYGPAFRGIERLWRGPDVALAVIRQPPGDAGGIGRYVLHPALLDACFQTLVGTLAGPGGGMETCLPVGIDKTVVYAAIDAGARLYAHAIIRRRDDARVVGDIKLLNEQGAVLAAILGFNCQVLGGRRRAERVLTDSLYTARWTMGGVVGASSDGVLSPGEIAARVRPRLADVVDGRERAEYYRDVEPALDRACASIAAAAFAGLGRPLAAGEHVDLERFCRDIRAGADRTRLIGRMFTMLERNGLAQRTASGWQIGASIPPPVAVANILQPLAQRFPLYAPELDLIKRCAEYLPQVIRGETDPLQLIFPDGSLAVAERIYRDSRSFGVYNAIGREAVRAIVEALPENATLRILEIGAGVGSLTAEILGLLPPERTQYVYTDVSATFTQKAAQQLARYRFVEYRTLDLEQAPATQGFEPNSFDLVLASDVLHATRDLRRSLAHVKELLAPGGLLIACELTRPPFWFDLVFGLLPGWWLFEDQDVRPDHACVGGATWRTLAAGTGFPDVELLAEEVDHDETIHSVVVARAAKTADSRPEPGPRSGAPWLVLRDRGDVGVGLSAALDGLGQRVLVADRAKAFRQIDDTHFEVAPAAQAMDALIEAVLARHPDLQGVVYLWALDGALGPDDSATSVLTSAHAMCDAALNLMKALIQAGAKDPMRLVLASAGAQHVLASDRVDPTQASLWGLGRVFCNEYPAIRCAMIDLPHSPQADEIAALAAECLGEPRESEVAVRGRSRFVHRLERTALDHLAPGHERAVGADEAFHLDCARTGAFENLLVRSSARIAPGPGQVEIRVATVGLNFRDVMKVLGIYPSDDKSHLVLGDECAGTIVAVGEGVDDLAVGERVVAIAPGFGSHVTVNRPLVARLPESISFADGATLPICFLTAYYALHRLGKLAAGERVLIHAAAGGVGQAAVQLALAAGATVFATAGTDEKREFLRSLGVAHVMDSRSLEFADQVMALTGGEGIDLVLNSLSGRAIPKSLALLRPYGRFLEIGKTDIYRDSRLGLRPFRKNLSYFAIDLDAVFRERPALAGELLGTIMDEVARGRAAPLLNRVFPLSDAGSAFRFMAQAKHIGKVVLSMEDPRIRLAPRKFRALPLRADGCYLITGGLGGIGRALAGWMIDRGARHLVLMGRSGANADAQKDVDALRARGARVEIIQCNVANETELEAQLRAIRRRGASLRGVVHGAMVLDDALIPQLDGERLRRAFEPKLGGAWALHRLTLDDPLDFFVMFSSFAATVGNIGQGNYSAANSFLDALAHRRRSEGRPALTVNWGAIGSLGYVAQHAEIEQHFRRQGLRSFSPEQAFAVLEALLSRDAVHVGVVDIDWTTWSKFAPEIATSPRFRHLLASGQTDTAGRDSEMILEQIRAAPSEKRKDVLLKSIQEQLAAVLGLAVDKVDANQAPSLLGLDSLMAVELSCLIEDRLGFKPATMELIQAPSLTALADRLAEKIAS